MMMKTIEMTMKLTMMILYDNDDFDEDYDDDDDSNDDNESYNDNENDMNDDDNDPYKKVLVEVNKPSFTTRSKIKMCSIIVISYACFKWKPYPICFK